MASPQCASPTPLGTIGVSQSNSATNNLVPGGTEAWYSVTFSGNATIHPKVSFSNNLNDEFMFDVQTNCSGAALACGNENTQSKGIVVWETQFTGQDPNQPANSPDKYQASPGVGVPLYIHVYRKPGAPITCNDYTLTVSG